MLPRNKIAVPRLSEDSLAQIDEPRGSRVIARRAPVLTPIVAPRAL
jgi:hypothetical protein